MNRLGRFHRRSVYAVGAGLFLTGIAWAILHYAPHLVGADERDARSDAATLMKVHGAAAMAALVLLGTLIFEHVGRGWRQARNKTSGIAIVVLSLFLAVTGYLLYYVGTEDARQIASYVHLALGAALPLPVLVHAFRMMRLRARRRFRLPSPAAALPRIRSPRSRPPPGRIRPGDSPGRESG